MLHKTNQRTEETVRNPSTVLLLGLQGEICRFCEILPRVKQNLHHSTLSPVGKNQQGCLWLSAISALCAFVLLCKSLPFAGNSNSVGTLGEKDKRTMKITNYMKRTFIGKLDQKPGSQVEE